MSLLQSLQKQQKDTGRVIETGSVTVTSIIPLAEDKCPKDKNGNIIPKSQIITTELGSIFCFTSSIINSPASFAHGAKAQVTLEEVSYKNKEGKEVKGINVNRLEFTTSDEFMRSAALYGTTVAETKK